LITLNTLLLTMIFTSLQISTQDLVNLANPEIVSTS